jgi:uncharacterized protein DUF4154
MSFQEMRRINTLRGQLALLLLLPLAAWAQDVPSPARTDQLKAGYVLNFARFVEWPEFAPSTLTLCVVGNSGVLEALRGTESTNHIGARTVSLREVGDAESFEGCNILYLETSNGRRVGQVLPNSATLTVSDDKGFTRSGGAIELFTQANRLRFIINTENARRAGLRISSSLLQLAAVVEDGENR